jgi:hypothetical protein
MSDNSAPMVYLITGMFERQTRLSTRALSITIISVVAGGPSSNICSTHFSELMTR